MNVCGLWKAQQRRYSTIAAGAIVSSRRRLGSSRGAEDDLCLWGVDIPSAISREDLAYEEEFHLQNTSLVRADSNGSPVCVASIFDPATGCPAIAAATTAATIIDRSAATTATSIVNDNVAVHKETIIDDYNDVWEDDEDNMDFVDFDKLDEAISQLCDSEEEVTKKKGDTDKPKTRRDSKSLMDMKVNPKKTSVDSLKEDFVDENIVSLKEDFVDEDILPEIVASHEEEEVVDEDIPTSQTYRFSPKEDLEVYQVVSQPVTPEYPRYFGEERNIPFAFTNVPPPITPRRGLFLPMFPDSERFYPDSFSAPSLMSNPMTMPPSDAIMMMPTKRNNDSGLSTLLTRSEIQDYGHLCCSVGTVTPPPAAARVDHNPSFCPHPQLPPILPPRHLFETQKSVENEPPLVTKERPVTETKEPAVTEKTKRLPDAWVKYYKLAIEFRQVHGHCCIPYNYPPNKILAAWAKRQRYQYTLFKRLQENGRVGAKKATSMTEERIDMLNAIDFVWDIQDAQFEVYLMMYRKYKEEHGHGKVPKLHGKEGLGRWVGSQRTLLRRGKMSVSRFLKLKEAGFEWHSHTCGNYDIAASLAKMEMKAKGMKAKA